MRMLLYDLIHLVNGIPYGRIEMVATKVTNSAEFEKFQNTRSNEDVTRNE